MPYRCNYRGMILVLIGLMFVPIALALLGVAPYLDRYPGSQRFRYAEAEAKTPQTIVRFPHPLAFRPAIYGSTHRPSCRKPAASVEVRHNHALQCASSVKSAAQVGNLRCGQLYSI